MAENYYVSNPSNCPTTYQSQTCTGSNVVCGYSGGVTFCYAPLSITSPTGTATSNTNYACQDTCDGGYLIDCYAYDGSAPHCDNGGSAICDRNSTCYTTQVRDTTCTANVWNTSTCGNCRSGYQDCTGDDVCEVTTGSTNYPTGANNNYGASCSCACDSNYKDCDGGANDCDSGNGCEYHYNVACASHATNTSTCNECKCDTNYWDCTGGIGDGCEVQDGGSCSVGSLSGTYDCSGASGTCWDNVGTNTTCTCIVSKSYFETGTWTNYSTTDAMLWFKNFGTGNLMTAINSTNHIFNITQSLCIQFSDGTTQCTASTGSSEPNFNGNFSLFNPFYNQTTPAINYFNGNPFNWISASVGSNLNLNNNNITNVSTISINNPPVECPAGSYMTRFLGNSSTCSSYDTSEPLWSANYSAFNTSWSSTYNSTYMPQNSSYNLTTTGNISAFGAFHNFFGTLNTSAIGINSNLNMTKYNTSYYLSAEATPICSKYYNSTAILKWCDCYNSTHKWMANTC